jgi:hypothetical protein
MCLRPAARNRPRYGGRHRVMYLCRDVKSILSTILETKVDIVDLD